MALKKVKATSPSALWKLEAERERSVALEAENNGLRNMNVDLVGQLSVARAALDEKARVSAEAQETLRVQLADAHGRLDNLAVELADARSDLTSEREEAAAALASKGQDQATIRALREEARVLRATVALIRDALGKSAE